MGTLLVLGSSTILFTCIKQIAKRLLNGSSFTKIPVRQVWLWRNTFCSFIHSFVSSLWTILCYHNEPMLLTDLLDAKSDFARNLMAFTTGYFIYDLADILLHDKFRQWEIICHHVTSIVAFSIALINDSLHGFGVCALIMEFNSVFLHLRRLMKLGNMTNNAFFKVNNIMNLLTLVFVRICTCCWMIRWLIYNSDRLKYVHYLYGMTGMCVMTLTNIGLMYRLWQSDFKRKTLNTKIFSELKK